MICDCPACWCQNGGPEEDEIGPLTSRTVRFDPNPYPFTEIEISNRSPGVASSIYSDAFWERWLADPNRPRFFPAGVA
jgi:hypothetical protein